MMKNAEGPLLLIGGTLAALGISHLVKQHLESGLTELRGTPSPALPNAPPPAPPPVTPPPPIQPTGPVRLAEPFVLAPGGRYVAAVTIKGPLFIASSESNVGAEARKQGFPDAVATKNKPSGLPLANGDYYVTADYAGPARTYPSSNLGGRVIIEDVWRIG